MDMPPRDPAARDHDTRLSAPRANDAARHAGLIAGFRMGLWSVCYFAFYLGQQIAELLAPLVLILGIGWALLPHVVDAITTSLPNADPQARDVMNHVAGSIPQQITLAGHLMTPSSLIFDGFLLMALAALGATVSALAARNM